MRLFLIALIFSATATWTWGQAAAQQPSASGSRPIKSSRFEPTQTDNYLMQRARAESEHRTAMLRYYDSIGFNYGAPEINGGVLFTAPPPVRYRRVVWMPSMTPPTWYGW